MPKSLRYRYGLRSARPNRFIIATHDVFYFWGYPPRPPKQVTMVRVLVVRLCGAKHGRSGSVAFFDSRRS